MTTTTTKMTECMTRNKHGFCLATNESHLPIGRRLLIYFKFLLKMGLFAIFVLYLKFLKMPSDGAKALSNRNVAFRQYLKATL